MEQERKLVPVFIPPLANLLALAEQKKQSTLTQAEVEKVRDGGVCIMMDAGDGEKIMRGAAVQT